MGRLESDTALKITRMCSTMKGDKNRKTGDARMASVLWEVLLTESGSVVVRMRRGAMRRRCDSTRRFNKSAHRLTLLYFSPLMTLLGT